MTYSCGNEPMLDIYIFETTQMVEQLENSILEIEQSGFCTPDSISEMFRVMHTVKGSSAMMLFDNISMLAHAIEDLFYFLREQTPTDVDWPTLSDFVLEGVDFIKIELHKLKNKEQADGDFSAHIQRIGEYLDVLKQQHPDAAVIVNKETAVKQQYYIVQDKSGNRTGELYRATIRFEDGCEMENIRAFSIVHRLQETALEISYCPEDIMSNHETVEPIREDGFRIAVRTDWSYERLHDFFMETLFLKSLELTRVEHAEEAVLFRQREEETRTAMLQQLDLPSSPSGASTAASMISVNVDKLDKLMDLVGELVIAESMVTQHPELKGLNLDHFHKVARRLGKITSELQDAVMSIRMVTLSGTFHKMNRIVRDMCKKLDKEVRLELIGEDTEVDKNIIERISDPLMHLIRNSVDHGIGSAEEREAAGKERAGTITLEARNAGGEVLITVKDDGRGLNKAKILQRAKENNLLYKKEEEMSDKEIYSLIFYPGFSTKDDISSFSGRGVGMDVVASNLEGVGGEVTVESTEGTGTAITLKIPLTLAIIDGMNLKVGESRYTLPIIAIQESFRPKEQDWIRDPDGQEMIMVRGRCIPILRLHRHFGVQTEVTSCGEGIMILVEHNGSFLCIYADELVGQQQVVIKPLPNYIRNMRKIPGLGDCTLLGDGKISLILDVAGLMG